VPPFDQDAEDARQFARQETVNRAVAATDSVILAYDGEREEMTVQVAHCLLAMATEAATISFAHSVEVAAYEALEVVMNHAEDDVAVRNWLKMQVAMKFVTKVEGTRQRELSEWDALHPAEAK